MVSSAIINANTMVVKKSIGDYYGENNYNTNVNIDFRDVKTSLKGIY